MPGGNGFSGCWRVGCHVEPSSNIKMKTTDDEGRVTFVASQKGIEDRKTLPPCTSETCMEGQRTPGGP